MRTGVFPVCGALKPFVQLRISRATQFSIVPKTRVTLSPPEQVILFVHSACAMSLHACSIVGAAEVASGPPSVDFDEVPPHPPRVTSAKARNAPGMVGDRSNEIDDMPRPIGLVPPDLSRRVLSVTTGTKSRSATQTVVSGCKMQHRHATCMVGRSRGDRDHGPPRRDSSEADGSRWRSR